ncbi:DUF4192 domain-containing protein [Arthrobacter sp. NicSoilC5]|uniref:DUF4192 domain-containing protein n=1 Tax=Arthrobacter sp. NicSoilC5 TaxID=2831000 RepID=UPI001CC50FB0|nr:DUF4192 domain-containing protein [Arthrobacter sp. NicSoilC5]BCW78290.1 hypothetical protein NicSoilC5_03090 [Arthrobacter sp. NicSoilC5]
MVPYQNDAHHQQPQNKVDQEQETGIMEKLTIKTPPDVLSFIGHTLGFWPQESLVCITLNENSVGATLRIDLPRQPGQELSYARTVAHYLTSDTNATSLLFAVYTSEPCQPGKPKPHASTIAALTGVLAEQGITIRDGLFVGDQTFSPYDGEPGHELALPVSSTQTSAINAEFIYRGSNVQPTNQVTLPASTRALAKAAAVEHHMDTIRSLPTGVATQTARDLWAGMLDTASFPSDDDCHALVANLQFPAIRDWLIADIPGLEEPMTRILFAQTEGTPKWSRIEWAQQLLLHAYTRTSPEHAAPVLTTIGYINWWEGRGSKAHQFLQLALETDPAYRLARLSDQMIGSGLVAGWNMNKNTAYKALPFD